MCGSVVGWVGGAWWELSEGRRGGRHDGLLRRLAHLSQALPAYCSCLRANVILMTQRSKDELCGSGMHYTHATRGHAQSGGINMQTAHAESLHAQQSSGEFSSSPCFT